MNKRDILVMLGSVTRFYINKSFICGFSKDFIDDANGRMLKKLIRENWKPPFSFAEMAEDVVLEYKLEYGYTVSEDIPEDQEATHEYEVTLMGDNIYIAYFHEGSLLFYGKVEDMPEEVKT